MRHLLTQIIELFC